MVKHEPGIVGWREWVRLPDLGDFSVKAKVDTGARTSAIHAFDIESFVRDGQEWVTFELHPVQHRRNPKVAVEAVIKEHRRVRSSNGTTELRPVISTTLVVGGTVFSADLTLTNRDEMGFRMLLGRSALKRRFLVDPSRSFHRGAAGI